MIAIEDTDTFESLHDKLMVLGGEAIVEALSLLETGALEPEKQDDTLSCHAKLITKEMGNIDFEKSANEVNRLVRGLNPWPSAYTFYKGKQLKIWETQVENEITDKEPGTITEVTKTAIKVACKEGVLSILSLQLEGKKRMSTHDFLLGVKVQPGELFTTEK